MTISVAHYWETRYARGGYSGEGSRGKEAEDKIWLVNRVIRELDVKSLLDLGCGDGYIAGAIEVDDYTGYDLSPTALQMAKGFRPDGEFTRKLPRSDERFDLTISMDVIFHLVDERLYLDYMDALFNYSDNVLVYGTDKELQGRSHVLHRVWTKDIPDGWNTTIIPMRVKRAWLITKD